MLNEIFKGMDNAAQAIDDNFNELKNMEIGKDPDNPYHQYLVLPNGITVVFALMSGARTIQAGQTIEVTQTYPITMPTKNHIPVVTATSSSSGIVATVISRDVNSVTFSLKNTGNSVAYVQAYIIAMSMPN